MIYIFHYIGTSPPQTAPIVDGDGTNEEGSASKTRKRIWRSPVWKHYDLYEGETFDDGISRALCKYCGAGSIIADSTSGTSNFARHTESCEARTCGGQIQTVIGKDGKFMRKIDHVA